MKIYVEDVNDNAPTFTSITYNVLMTDTTPAGTYILTVSGTDADLSPGPLTYAITQGNEDSKILCLFACLGHV